MVVILIDSEKFEEIVKLAGSKKSVIINTEHCNEDTEYDFILNSMRLYSMTDKKIMLVKFSGKESVLKNLGDESSEMIVAISDNKKNAYYTQNPINTFLDLIKLF